MSLKPNVAYLVFELLRCLEAADDLAVPGKDQVGNPAFHERTGRGKKRPPPGVEKRTLILKEIPGRKYAQQKGLISIVGHEMG